MPPITNGGYRFPYFEDFEHTIQYNEYWYFGFHDNRSGLTGMAAFGVFHPDGTILGRSLFTAALFEPGGAKPYRAMDLYSMKEFSSSPERADVQVGANNRVLAESPDLYHIVGRSKDGALRLDLRYRAVAPPVLAGKHLPGPLDWEWDSWILALPGAEVSGTVTLHGTRHEITHGGGYHDHSWGIWMLPERIWAWATASDPERGVHVIAGYKCGFAVSTAYVHVGGHKVFFDSSKDPMDWKADPEGWINPPGILSPPYPVRAHMVTEDPARGYRLRVEWQVEKSVLIDKSPIALYEQAARLTVILDYKDPSGGAEEHYRFDDLVGHSQFISRWLRPTPPGDSLGVD